MSAWRIKLCAGVLACACLACGSIRSFAQIYHVYRPLPQRVEEQVSKDTAWGWEAETAVVLTEANVEDAQGYQVSSSLAGGSLSLWRTIFSGVSVGVQGEFLRSKGTDEVPSLQLDRRSAVLLLRWTVTPDTMSRLYLSAGGGAAFYDGNCDFIRAKMSRTGAVWKAALSMQAPLFSQLFLTGAFGVSYEPSSWRNFALHSSSRIRREISFGLAAYW